MDEALSGDATGSTNYHLVMLKAKGLDIWLHTADSVYVLICDVWSGSILSDVNGLQVKHSLVSVDATGSSIVLFQLLILTSNMKYYLLFLLAQVLDIYLYTDDSVGRDGLYVRL